MSCALLCASWSLTWSPKPIRAKPEMMSALDRATSAQMAALLHAPDFPLLESAWRALFFLVRKVETSERLKIYLLEVSKT